MRYLQIITILCFCISCNDSGNQKELNNSKPTVFEIFINETFDYDIPLEEHDFILVPHLSCGGCVHLALSSLDYDFIEEHHNSITFITEEREYFDQFKEDYFNVLYDDSHALSRYDLPVSNVTVIHTRNHKIEDIRYIDPKNKSDWPNMFNSTSYD